MKKSIISSKTFWANLIAIALLILPNLIDMGFEIDPKWIALIMAILNIVLRMITKKAVGLTGDKKQLEE